MAFLIMTMSKRRNYYESGTFFIVNTDSQFCRKYKENRQMVNEKIKEFFQAAGIETHGYYCNKNQLWLIPTVHDKKKFAGQICAQSGEEGLRRFKKRSEINQSCVAFIADAKIIEPYMFIYFDGLYGPGRLFFDGDMLYCFGEVDDGTPVPDGLTEIKGSEFFAVIKKMEA